MVCSDRSTDQGHRLTTQPRRARPEEPEVEEPARAGGSTTPSSPNRTKTTRIIDQESPVVDQGSERHQGGDMESGEFGVASVLLAARQSLDFARQGADD